MHVAAGQGVESEMVPLVVREVEGWDQRVPGVATGGAGGWALDPRCVHQLGAAAGLAGAAYSEVGMTDGMVDEAWRKT